MSKTSYQTLVTMNMLRHYLRPGESITMTLRSEQEGIYQLAERLWNMFLATLSYFPESIAVHPDHLAILKKQGKSLDVTIPEEIAPIIRDVVELTDIPASIPFVADENLDLFSAVARAEFKEEGSAERMVDALMYALTQRT